MPFKEYHNISITDKEYPKYRWDKEKFGKGITSLFGITDSGKIEIKSLRFDKNKWSESEAKKWTKEHDFSIVDSEPAKKESLMRFKEYLEEKKTEEYEPRDWVVLKPSGYKRLKKQNPKVDINLYKKFRIEKIPHQGDTAYVSSSFLDDPNVKLRAVEGTIDLKDIERKYDWKTKK